MGIARALASFDETVFEVMRDGGFLTRDARMKERNKPGLHGARSSRSGKRDLVQRRSPNSGLLCANTAPA